MAGNIKGITIEFQGDTSKLDKSLREVNKNTRAIDKELKQVNTALKFNPTSVDLWRQKQTLLTQKIRETETKLDALKRKQASMDAAGVDKNSAEYRKLQREIIETESKLKTFNAQLKQIGNAKLTALGNQFKAVGDKMTAVGQNLTQKVTAPLALGMGVAAKKFAEVDKTMQLTNSTMNNSTEEAALLNQAMKDAAASSTFGMNDAATASLNFARAGLTAEQAANALAPAMALAAGEGGELDVVSSGLVATINGFHGSFDQAGHYADVFANACNNSALDVNSLSQAMSVAAPIFASAGYEVNDAALFMGVMANNGIEASVAANSLKTGLARLVSPASDGAAMMEKLGISITNSDGSMKDSVTVQKELHDAFSRLSESEQIAAASAIFGKNQMAPWLALINTAPGDVDALNEAIGQTGTAMDMQSAMMSGFAGSIEQLKSGLDVLATSFGEALAPMIQKVVGVIQGLVNWFNALSPTAQKIIAVIAVLAAALGPVLVIVGTLASAIGSIISLVGVVGPAIAGLAGPIGIAVAIIAALIAIGVLLYKNWDKIKATALAVKNAVVTAWTQLKAQVAAILKGIQTTASTIWTGIRTKVTSIVTAIKTSVVNAFSGIRGKVSSIWNGIKSAITSPINSALSTVRSAMSKIKSAVNGASLKLPKIKLPHFKISGKLSISPPSVPKVSVNWYKTGGIFDSPSIVGIGEAGPEAVVPLDTLWNKLDAIADANRGEGVTINVYAAQGMDVNQLATEIEARLVRLQKQRFKAWGY